MKKIYLFLILIISNIGYAQSYINFHVQVNDLAYIKKGEEINSKILIIVPKGEAIKILRKAREGLYEVKYKEIVGYMVEYYLPQDLLKNSKEFEIVNINQFVKINNKEGNEILNNSNLKLIPLEDILSLIKLNVEDNINKWQVKNEFEKTVDYRKRVNEENRIKKSNEIQQLITSRILELYASSINWETATLGKYDADNETFIVTIDNLDNIIVNIDITDAPSFKYNWKNIKFTKPEFLLTAEGIKLTKLSLYDSWSRKVYKYDLKDKNIYSNLSITYNFKKIDYNSNLKTIEHSSKIVERGIEVGQSDVDTDIPTTNIKQISTYALIIGNEDYKSKQRGLTVEQNVDFAMNDAEIFKLYCEKTLGIPQRQIRLLENATTTEIKQGLAWISNLSKFEKGNSKLIFYYSGHGLPDEQTKEAFIIPVDVAGTSLEYAVRIADVYKELTKYPAKQITVFLDACFSGGARNQGLIAMKGIKVKPKKDIITGNMVVFTSSSGDESSAVYREKQHGYFTYYLLKKLKETQGQTDYYDLSNYIIDSVRKEAGLSGKIQTPQVNASLKVENEWKLWKLK